MHCARFRKNHPFNMIVECLFMLVTIFIDYFQVSVQTSSPLFFTAMSIGIFPDFADTDFLHFGTLWLPQITSSKTHHHSHKTHNLNFQRVGYHIYYYKSLIQILSVWRWHTTKEPTDFVVFCILRGSNSENTRSRRQYLWIYIWTLD